MQMNSLSLQKPIDRWRSWRLSRRTKMHSHIAVVSVAGSIAALFEHLDDNDDDDRFVRTELAILKKKKQQIEE